MQHVTATLSIGEDASPVGNERGARRDRPQSRGAEALFDLASLISSTFLRGHVGFYPAGARAPGTWEVGDLYDVLNCARTSYCARGALTERIPAAFKIAGPLAK